MLSKNLAQNIVNKMMDVIPYNVNVMDSKGIIIGSGDPQRIGLLHEGALKALETKNVAEVYKNKNNTKHGVNSPIFFRDKVIGVIGITGDPKDVCKFTQIVSVTAELLINQEYTLNKHIIREKLKEEYIYEWLYSKEIYDYDFIQRGKALDIDITLDRFLALIKCPENYLLKIKDILNNFLKENEYFIKISSDKVILILLYNKHSLNRLHNLRDKLKQFNIKLGTSSINETIHNSLIESTEAIEIGSKLYKDIFLYTYDKIKIFHQMNEFLKFNQYKEILNKILDTSKGFELLETFLTYISLNGDRTSISNHLHIHRNTLNYRLDKIEDITGLKFDNYLDLFQLITAYIEFNITDYQKNNNS